MTWYTVHPIQDEKTTVTLSFWVALVEREKKKDIQHSESVFISLRRRKRDQKIHYSTDADQDLANSEWHASTLKVGTCSMA